MGGGGGRSRDDIFFLASEGARSVLYVVSYSQPTLAHTTPPNTISKKNKSSRPQTTQMSGAKMWSRVWRKGRPTRHCDMYFNAQTEKFIIVSGTAKRPFFLSLLFRNDSLRSPLRLVGDTARATFGDTCWVAAARQSGCGWERVFCHRLIARE